MKQTTELMWCFDNSNKLQKWNCSLIALHCYLLLSFGCCGMSIIDLRANSCQIKWMVANHYKMNLGVSVNTCNITDGQWIVRNSEGGRHMYVFKVNYF